MGNSNSQTLHPSAHQSHQQWAHSYPRDTQYRSPSQQPQVKVLPERIPGQRLRVTDNGAILHNGGTISGRRQSIGQSSHYLDEDDEVSERVYRSRSSSHHRPTHQDNSGLSKLSSKRFGSEPDLRQPAPHSHNDSPAKQRISRGRKKYRAPPPPPEGDSRGPDSSSPDSYHWDNLDPPARRLRLFKTREETKKAPMAQRQLPTPDEENQASNGIHHARSITINDNWGDLVRNIPDHTRNVIDHSANLPDQPRSMPEHVGDRIDHIRNIQEIHTHTGNIQEPSRNGLDHIRINVLDYPRNATEHNIKIVIPEHVRNIKGIGRESQNVGKMRRASREEKTSIDSLSVIPRVNGIRYQPQPHPHSPTPVHRSLSTPEFQMELLKAAQRLSPAAALVSRTDLNGRHDRREEHRREDFRSGRGEFRESVRRDDLRGRGEFEEREFRESVRREDLRGRGEFEEREFRESVRREDLRGRGEFEEREFRESVRREDLRGRGEFEEREFRESIQREEDQRGRGEFVGREFREEGIRREEDRRWRGEFGERGRRESVHKDEDRRGRGESREREFREDGIRREEDVKREHSRAVVSRRGRFEAGGKDDARDEKIRGHFRTGRGESRDRELLADGRRGRERDQVENERRVDSKSDSSGRRESRGSKGVDHRRRNENRRDREPRKENGRRSRDRSRDLESRGVLAGPLELRLQGDGSGKESSPAPTSSHKQKETRKESRKPSEKQWEIITPNVQRPLERDVPTKTFYFGMEQGERDAVERFAASIHRVPLTHTPSGSGGSLCSEVEEEVDGGSGSIALQLRPTLPKKQLEIPRFSPTTAWRLLSALEAPTPVNVCEEVPVVQEERILRSSRPMAPLPPQQQQQHAPRSHDKSGDSGISGDASPGGLHEDSSEAPLASPPMRKTLSPPPHERPMLAAWTPQQDLGEEESSSDGDVDESLHGGLVAQPKFSPRAQVFSLSLPRDNRLGLALYSDSSKNKRDSQPSFNSLKKLKRSVSGALNALGTTAKGKEDEKVLDENWLLSRSVPNSLTSGHVKPNHSRASSPSTPDLDRSQRTSFSYLASGGHVMYLPDSGRQDLPDRLYPTPGLRGAGMMSKSCENISTSEMRELDRTPSPDVMIGQERVSRSHDKSRKDSPTGKRGKNRRFTFQSTVRQIERRRISERLSRDAELKERRRLGELEAMRRVEEEFQRKRAPEKANIRQQLRLFNLDEQSFSSLPNGWADSARAEPDGAASSSPNSSTRAPDGRTSPEAAVPPGGATPQTQVLSEYREPRRDYREYRPARFTEVGPDVLPEKRATVHPPAVFDMPKSSQVYVTPHRQTTGITTVDVDPTLRPSSLDNYRKDFAHGAMRSLASSDSELSQPNTRPHSRQQSRSVSPSARRRSVSEPDSSSDEDNNPDKQQVSVAATNHINLTTVQPFSLSSKGYRPIAFTLGTKPPLTDAQFVK